MKCNYFLWGITIIILGFTFACQIPYFKLEDNYVGLVLGFVGILATFIVVSNYAQVQSIKDEFGKKVAKVEDDFNTKIGGFNASIEKLETDLNTKIDEDVRGVLEEARFNEILSRTIMQKDFNCVSAFIQFISDIKELNKKDLYSIRYVKGLEKTEIKMTNFNKEVLKSLCGLDYPYGKDFPKEFNDFIESIIEEDTANDG